MFEEFETKRNTSFPDYFSFEFHQIKSLSLFNKQHRIQ